MPASTNTKVARPLFSVFSRPAVLEGNKSGRGARRGYPNRAREPIAVISPLKKAEERGDMGSMVRKLEQSGAAAKYQSRFSWKPVVLSANSYHKPCREIESGPCGGCSAAESQ